MKATDIVLSLTPEERLVIQAWRLLNDEWKDQFSKYFSTVTPIRIPVTPKQKAGEVINFPGLEER